MDSVKVDLKLIDSTSFRWRKITLNVIFGEKMSQQTLVQELKRERERKK